MTAWLDDGDVRLYHGDALEQLALMPSESVQCIVTSPPFWGLRDYGMPGQIGLEETPDEWCAKLVAVMREARRVLRMDGVCWLECGDTYNANQGAGFDTNRDGDKNGRKAAGASPKIARIEGIKPKDLVGAPWLLAFALRADGWYLRSEVIWSKPNPMPESVTDRPTTAHSRIFLLTKSSRYFMDMDAIREPHSRLWGSNNGGSMANIDHDAAEAKQIGQGHNHRGAYPLPNPAGANARSVWSIPTQPTPWAHFATFPEAIVERCIKAGSAEGDLILDPFMGSGTTALVARRLGRHAVGIELNLEYLAISAKRLQQLSLFSTTGADAPSL